MNRPGISGDKMIWKDGVRSRIENFCSSEQ